MNPFNAGTGRTRNLALEYYDIEHPRVSTSTQGLTILHLSDFHIHKPWREDPKFQHILNIISSIQFDLLALTGDYIERRGSEQHAAHLIDQIAAESNPRLGAYGVFGNHDTPELIRILTASDRVHWLQNQTTHIGHLRILGTSEPEDLLAAIAAQPSKDQNREQFSILLAHYPTQIVPAAAIGIDLVLAGHTHGGQVRISPRFCPHTSCDLPAHAATGLIRLRSTLCCISRGIGVTVFPFRLRCPPQIALYTLKNGPLRGDDRSSIVQIIPW